MKPDDLLPIVDVHAHHFPVGLPDLVAETGDERWPSLVVDDDPRIMLGDTVFRRVAPACFDLDARIADLDAAGVHRQVISPVPITLVDWAPADDALRFLSTHNDLLADIAERSAGRLLAMAAVPLQAPELAVGELLRARNELGMRAVEIGARVGGRELDDTLFDPFWRAAAEHDVAVFVHPTRQRDTIRRTGAPYDFGLDMTTDTAIAAGSLVFGGVLERHPGLRVALAHGCGTFPWAYPRLRYISVLQQRDAGPRLDALVGQLWADALVFDAKQVALLIERFGVDHVLLGTDHPFLPEGFEGPLAVLRDAGAPAKCSGANALSFLGLPAVGAQ